MDDIRHVHLFNFIHPVFGDSLCRIDVRLDKKGNLIILDINSPPGMLPPEVSVTSYFPLEACAAGNDYEMLIQAVIGHALRRYGSEKIN